MLHLYEQKSESRDELVRQARRAMLELVQSMRDGLCDHPKAEQLMQELAVGLGTVKGKKTYGYLPKRLKGLVDEIVDQMERLPVVSQCYDQWLLIQGKVDSYYHDKPRERLPLSKERSSADQKRRHPGSGAAGPDHLRGPGHCPAGRAGAVSKCALCVLDAAGGHPQ